MPISIDGKHLRINFIYSQLLVDLVRLIPDRTWNKTDKSWVVPADSWHAKKAIEILDGHILIDEAVRKLASNEDVVSTKPRRRMNTNLYPFQEAGVEFAVRNKGRVILADEMGLGKTVQAIDIMRRIRPKISLVVCPASVSYKWKLELEAWLPMFSSQVLATTKDELENVQVFICSYEIMLRKFNDLRLTKIDLVIFDECHKLKNYKAKRTKVAKSLTHNVPYVIGLSGTPMLNRPAELFSILNIIDPDKFPNWYSFGNQYCFTELEGFDGAKNLDELQDRLKTIMIRRLKRDVLDQLPELTRTVVPVTIDLAEYRKVMREQLSPGVPRLRGNLDKIQKAHTIIGREKAKIVVDMVQDMLEEKDKVVLYVVHREVASYLEQALASYKPLKIVGDTLQEHRQAVVQQWQNDTKNRVMIISRAGGEGINLFGITSDISTIIFVEREWNPASEEQAEARLHRIGQRNPVEAIYLIANKTIDHNVHALIESKRQLVGDVMITEDIDVRYDLVKGDGDEDPIESDTDYD